MPQPLRILCCSLVFMSLFVVFPSVERTEVNQDSTKGVPAKNQKQGKTEDRGPLPSDQKFHFADDYARGFKDGLNEHHAILEEIRKELDSTRNANTVFTWLYAIL